MITKPEIDVREKGFKNRISLKAALQIAFDHVRIKGIETINLREIQSSLKILAEDVRAKYSVPNFDRALMDGYALRSEDTAYASKTNAVKMKVIEELSIKSIPNNVIKPFQAIKIPTGGVLPSGADCVVPIEETIQNKTGDSIIEIDHSVEKEHHISRKGDDYIEGDLVFRKGTILSPIDVGVLLSIGIASIKCYKIPKIGILATGDEIVDEDRSLQPGEVYDSNSYVLVEYLNKIGIQTTRYKIIVDDYEAIKHTIQKIIEVNDIIITSGGTAVGKKDFIPLILNELSDVLIHGISIKPGAPTTFGVKNNKYFLGLPGFPVSNLISFVFFGLPIVLHMLGSEISFFRLKAVLTDDFLSTKGRTDFLRVKITYKNDLTLATPITVASSSLLRTLSKSDGIVILDETTEKILKDEIVTVMIIDKLINNNE